MSSYAITQAWARAFDSVGFSAVIAALRFSPGQDCGLALFGDAGSPDPGWPVAAAPVPVVDVAQAMDMQVVDAPDRGEIEFAEPDSCVR